MTFARAYVEYATADSKNTTASTLRVNLCVNCITQHEISMNPIRALFLTVLLSLTGAAVQASNLLPALVPTQGNPYPTNSTRLSYGQVTRTTLTEQERQAVIPVSFELNLQHADELQARIDRGEVLTRAQVDPYLPSSSDYATVKAWLVAQGFTVTQESSYRHALFIQGTVSQLATSLQTTFGRVSTVDGEFTSALREPTLPTNLMGTVRAIRGLQTHLLRHHNHVPAMAQGLSPRLAGNYLDPSTLAVYYNAPPSLTGAGQTIAVVGDCVPLTSDLIQFWSVCGIPQNLANYTVISVQGGSGTDMTDQTELSVDVQWASSMAPGAAIRLYAAPAPFTTVGEDAIYTQILNDLPSNPTLRVTSESFLGPEEAPSSTHQLLAAMGVNSFAGSGDAGSNPNYSTGKYDTTQPIGVGYPSCDPNVISVGGTTLQLNEQGQALSPESGWVTYMNGTEIEYATGGGISTLSPRPSWQSGPGVPAGTTRCVPDVAAFSMPGNAYPTLYPFIIVNGQMETYGGTSLSCPIWAGLMAIIDQARSTAGRSPVGFLNTYIYTMLGTNVFNDIVSGTNGAYSAGPGYDLCSGVGSPNIANIISLLDAGLGVSIISGIPQGTVVNGSGILTLSASATGNSPTYQWYLNGAALVGATGSTLSVIPTAANQGAYTVEVTDNTGTASSSAGTLSVSTNAWLDNLSARAYTETGANQLIAGFVTTGTANKSLLIRGDGPSLAGFGITNFLVDPVLTLDSGSTTVASAASWSPSLSASFVRLGAFSLPKGSHDTALMESLAPGAYTAQVVSQTTNNGVALAEIYDADAGAPTNRLINLSARAFVGTGANILIGGFVISGTTPLTVVIRGDGPALTGFGLTGALRSTTLTLSGSSGTIATNNAWSTAPVTESGATGGITVQALTAAVSSQVGAFAIAAGSNDSAIIATLPPGAYTAQIAGANGATGVALVEIYEVR